jgi:hypothetical protein
VLVTNGRDNADFSNASEHMGSNIGTARVVAQILREELFVPVWHCDARLDRHLRNRSSPYLMPRGPLAQLISYFLYPTRFHRNRWNRNSKAHVIVRMLVMLFPHRARDKRDRAGVDASDAFHAGA